MWSDVGAQHHAITVGVDGAHETCLVALFERVGGARITFQNVDLDISCVDGRHEGHHATDIVSNVIIVEFITSGVSAFVSIIQQFF